MTERPIIFSTPMVKAVLDESKTMTRRIVRFPKWGTYQSVESDWDITAKRDTLQLTAKDGIVFEVPSGKLSSAMQDKILRCPYGQVGGRLWVRETWRILDNTMLLDDMVRVEYKADGQIIKRRYGDIAWNEMGIRLPAIQTAMETGKWMPSIHLPHILSRIDRVITEVRGERVQDISEEDCYKEGLGISVGMMLVEPHWLTRDVLRRKFKDLWDSLNAKRGYGWSVNPWVFPIEFKMVTK
ncbi:hypothetical protein LCGC14_1191440 [marine sediment metagenome]|uniref:Uncharacterized protein n=1 Tax=marine sediment metagenome TaxID=412755 RepID=A0A0F9M713_9ZZZZ